MHVTPLEPRRHFSVSLSLTTVPPPYARLDDNGVLRIFGSSVGDIISIEQSPFPTVQPDGLVTAFAIYSAYRDEGAQPQLVLTFDVTKVKRLAVYGGGGDDVLDFSVPLETGDLTEVAYPLAPGADVVTTYRPNVTYVSLKTLIDGGAGNDFIRTGKKNDVLFGGEGNDTLDGGFGADQITGGKGHDTVQYLERQEGVAVALGVSPRPARLPVGNYWGRNGTLADDGLTDKPFLNGEVIPDGVIPDMTKLGGTGGLENDRIRYDVETVLGGGGNDVILGNARANRLEGGAGNDFILGGFGNDILTGGADDDTFWTADTADGFPYIGIDEYDLAPGQDFISGGNGRDFLRGDGRDAYGKIEDRLLVPFLTS